LFCAVARKQLNSNVLERQYALKPLICSHNLKFTLAKFFCVHWLFITVRALWMPRGFQQHGDMIIFNNKNNVLQ